MRSLLASPRLRGALALATAAALLGACAEGYAPSVGPPVRTALDQYPLQAAPAPNEIALAPHASGLSQDQHNALSEFAQRWRAAGEGPVVVRAPEGAGPVAGDMARRAADRLIYLGVPRSSIQMTSYPVQGPGPAPVILGFQGLVAAVADCAQLWPNLTSTANNDVSSRFGCVEHANLAVMIADPRDIDQPRVMDPSDASRRAEVMTKYRKGSKTSSERDDQAKGTVSSSIQ